MSKISPFLWFDNEAEEAVQFYTSIFKNSKIGNVARYAEENYGGKPVGSVMTIAFQLDGQDFVALNGGPQFQFNEAVSFAVKCETQAEIDEMWEKLTEGGTEVHCGWLKDKYGVSWQVVPTFLEELLADSDAEKTGRVMQAIMQMKKLDIKALEEAHAGAAKAVKV